MRLSSHWLLNVEVVVDIAPVRKLARPVTLAAIKSEPLFKESPLVRQGRLSVVSLNDEQFRKLTGG